MEFYSISPSFSHSCGSCRNYPPKYKWNFCLPEQITKETPTVFVDYSIIEGVNYPQKNKFGWICESSGIVDKLIDWVWINNKKLQHSYEKIFVNDEHFLHLSNLFEYCPAGSNMPWISDFSDCKKTNLISIIASEKNQTEGHQIRHQIVNNYKNYIDVFGRSYRHIENKETGLKPYMFSFCIENAKYDLYYTEKLMDALVTKTIPIYWGSNKINTIFNTEGFIMYDETFDINMITEDLYISKLKYINENYEIARNMIPSDDVLQNKIINYLKD